MRRHIVTNTTVPCGILLLLSTVAVLATTTTDPSSSVLKTTNNGAEPRRTRRRAIVGGTAVENNTTDFSFFVQAPGAQCGGVLVAADVVLTSSVCSAMFQDQVLVGATARDGNGTGDGEQGQWRKVVRGAEARHPDADPSGLRDAPALFRIEPVTLDGVTPALLNWEASNPVLGQALAVAGFGMEVVELPPTEDGDDFRYYSGEGDYLNRGQYVAPDHLVKATVRAPDRDVCRAMGAYYIRWDYEDAKMMCTLADDKFGRGPCNGDAGGPLVDEDMKLVGIVSAAKDCNNPSSPSFYFRSSGYKTWIQETMCKLTGDRSALPFECPEFLCPLDAVVLGFPSAWLPNASNITRQLNNGQVTGIKQVPGAGTRLPDNSTTLVEVSAAHASGATVACVWTVQVPPYEEVAFASFDLSDGTSNAAFPVAWNYNNPAGKLYGMEVYANYFSSQSDDTNMYPAYNVSLTVTLRVGDDRSFVSPTFHLSGLQPTGYANFSTFLAYSSATDSGADMVVDVLGSSVDASIVEAGNQLTGYVRFFGQRKD